MVTVNAPGAAEAEQLGDDYESSEYVSSSDEDDK